MSTPSQALLRSAETLCAALRGLRFGPPVTHVYNPLEYARAPHEAYVKRFAATTKRALFMGMNPGPFGMTQTGVPFGEVAAVRDWMGIEEPVERPENEHPARPVEGFACRRSEVSGRRLWGWARDTFGTAEAFFKEHFVLNYCPLVFLEESGRNHTPDKLPAREWLTAQEACDAHLRRAIDALKPEFLIGVGAWAESRLKDVAGDLKGVKILRVLHPSPASPAANRGWAEAVTKTLREAGVLRG